MAEPTQFQRDLERGRWDGKFWSKRFFNIDIHPGQERMFKAALARQKTRPWAPAYYDIWISAGNRAGKTLGLSLVVLHSCFYKAGLKPPTNDVEAVAWRTHPYLWYHFGPSQLVANKLFAEIDMILKGIHPAQHGLGCPIAQELPHVADTEKKFEGEYRWIVLDPIIGGAEIHFRTTSEKATSSLGQDMQGESIDEGGFEPNLKWTYDNVFRMRRLGTGGQIIGISTPEEGHTDFSDLWQQGDPESPDRLARSFSMRMSTRDNIGFGIDARTFAELTEGMDEYYIKQNIDGFFIQGRSAYFNASSIERAFVDDLPEVQPARNGHVYIQAVDPGMKDKCWSLVFDLIWDNKKDELKEIVGVKAEISPDRSVEGIVGMAANNHNAYDINSQKIKTRCQSAVDNTGLGGHMFRDLLQEMIPYVHPVEFGGSVAKKRKMLGDVKTLFEKSQIRMPRKGPWLILRRQLLGYKTADKGLEQDGVTTIMVAGHELRRTPPPDGADDRPAVFDARALDVPSPAPTPNFRRPRHRRMHVVHSS